jgi:peptidase M23-like protein
MTWEAIMAAESGLRAHSLPTDARPSRASQRGRIGTLAVAIALCLLAFASASAADTGSVYGDSSAGPAAGLRTPGVRAQTTAIVVQAVGSPRFVAADDGHTHIEYDLVVTNGLSPDVTLSSLTVRARGRALLTLRGDALAAHTHPLGGTVPTRTIHGASAVAIVVDVVLPRKRPVPEHLGNTIRYAVAPSPINPIIGSRTVHGPRLRVGGPILIPPPLRGPGWYVGDGCCTPDSRHRSALLPTNGRLLPIETFAIDWARIRGGVIFHGTGTALSDYVAFGAKIYSVAAGRVVSVTNNLPEEPVNSDPIAPGIHNPDQFGGNGAVIKIGPGEYAFYGHMQPGSVRVKKGQRVRTGQVLGLLGNSGNTSFPHLHFSIQDGTSALASASVPYEFDRFRFRGRVQVAPTGPPNVVLTGNPHRLRRVYPLDQSVVDFRR